MKQVTSHPTTNVPFTSHDPRKNLRERASYMSFIPKEVARNYANASLLLQRSWEGGHRTTDCLHNQIRHKEL
jgi:hypothetical protein